LHSVSVNGKYIGVDCAVFNFNSLSVCAYTMYEWNRIHVQNQMKTPNPIRQNILCIRMVLYAVSKGNKNAWSK